MREKHVAIITVIVVFIAVAGTVANGIYTFGKSVGASAIGSEGGETQLVVPGEGTVREIDRLNARLSELARFPSGDKIPVDLGMLGYVDNEWRRSSVGEGELVPPGMDVSVSFAFSSKRRAYCVIEDTFCRQGSTVAGAQVVKIEANRVLLRKGDYQVWIPVGRPVQGSNVIREKDQEE